MSFPFASYCCGCYSSRPVPVRRAANASILYPLNNGRWGITWSPRARYASPGRAYRDHTFFRSRWMPETRCSRRAPPQPTSGDMGGILVTASTVTAWSSRLQHSLTFAHPRRRRRRTHCGPCSGRFVAEDPDRLRDCLHLSLPRPVHKLLFHVQHGPEGRIA